MHDRAAASVTDLVVVDVLMGDRLYDHRLLGGCATPPRWHRLVPDKWVRRHRRHSEFRVGWGAAADAPVDQRFVSHSAHTLIRLEERGCMLSPTAAMASTVWMPGGGQGPSMVGEGPRALPAGARATIVCGAITVQVGYAPAPTPIAAPRWHQRLSRNPHGWAALLATLLLALFLSLLPPQTWSLVVGEGQRPPRLATTIIPVEMPAVAVAPAVAPRGPGGGNEMPRRLRAAPPRRGGGPKAEPSRAPAQVDPARAGILGSLQRLEGDLHAVFAPAPAAKLGQVLGNLDGRTLADAWHVGGFAVDNRAGEGDALRGEGALGTIGGCRGERNCGVGKGGQDVDRAALRGRPVRRVDVITCPPGSGCSTRGGLDKDLVRRTIRARMNEIRHCYERRLEARPDLQGRLSVRFAIGPQGNVITAAVQASSLPDPAVASCVVAAMRRWQFPSAEGGGLTMVTYPFVFMTAGGQQ